MVAVGTKRPKRPLDSISQAVAAEVQRTVWSKIAQKTTFCTISGFNIMLKLRENGINPNLIKTFSQHDGVKTTMKQRNTQNSFKIHF